LLILLQVKCLILSGLLTRPWLRIRLDFCLLTLTKPNHGPSKTVDDPREVRLTDLRSYWLKDIGGGVFEVDISRSVLSPELFEGVANLAHRGIKLFLRQSSRYWSNNALCQIRYFVSHVERWIHHYAPS